MSRTFASEIIANDIGTVVMANNIKVVESMTAINILSEHRGDVYN